MTETVQLIAGLFAGHFVGDFLLQTRTLALNKHRVSLLLFHCLLVTGATYLLCGLWDYWPLPLAVFIAHLLIDGLKSLSGNQGVGAYLLDQAVHLGALVAIGIYLVPSDASLYWASIVPNYAKGLVILSGAIACILTGGYCVEKTMAPFAGQVTALLDGLPNAGRLIGQLERGLIFLLVLSGYLQGVGFLVAAKSILRFGEIKEPGQRKEAEYIIIGTLLSFGWGLLMAIATVELISYV